MVQINTSILNIFIDHKQQVITETMQFVRAKLEGEGTGHDWFHIERVHSLALKIAEHEAGADLFIVSLGALLHDIADWKFTGGDETIAPRIAGEWLTKCGVQQQDIEHVQDIIKSISFKGAGVTTNMKTLEGMIVQDADRLDALGAIGIARCFAYGGSKHRVLYDPAVKPQMHGSFEEYKKSVGTTLNHFYEKLFLLKNRMNTKTANKIAQQRHDVMQNFVDTFLKEWEVKDFTL